MKKALGTILAVALAGAAAGAAAQAQAPSFRHEVSLFGSWDDVDEPEKAETLNLSLRYGYFVSPKLVATASLGRTTFEGGGVDTKSTTFLVGAKYYFSELRSQSLVPFVDGGVGFTTIDTGRDDGTDFSWEFGGGVAFMFSENVSFDAALRLYNTDADIRTKGTRAFIGLTTRF
jgi:opacity protein-like surface antigen